MIDLAVCCSVIFLFGLTWRFTEPYDIARMLSYVWCPSLLLAHIVIGTPGGLTGTAFLYVSAIILMNVLGARLASTRGKRRGDALAESVPLERLYSTQGVYMVLIVACVLGVFGCFQLIWRHGFTLADYFSFSRLSALASSMYDVDYSVDPIGLSSIYLCPLLGGFLYCSKRKRWVVLSIAFFPALLLMLQSSRKAVILCALTLFMAAYFSSVLLCKRRVKLSRRGVYRLGVVVVVVVVMFALSFGMRYGMGSSLLRGDALRSLVGSYGVAHAACLDVFLREEECTEVKLGARTFLGPSSLLGLEERKRGVYEEMQYFTNRDVTVVIQSNVYSAFRPLVEDFTVLGSLFVALLSSFLVGIVGKRMPRPGSRALRAFRVVGYTAALQYAMYSFITSPWSYNSVVASLLLFGAVLLLFSRRYSDADVEVTQAAILENGQEDD